MGISHFHTRRGFLRQAGLLVLTGTFGTALGCDSSTANDFGGSSSTGDSSAGTNGITLSGTILTIDLTQQVRLASAGGFLLVQRISGQSVRAALVNVDGTEIRAFTSICTHQACDINHYSTGSQRLQCPCHGSQFDLDGRAVRGPATRALTPYTVNRNGDTVTVTLA